MEEVTEAVAGWARTARECGCEEESLARIARAHRRLWARGDKPAAGALGGEAESPPTWASISGEA